MHPLSHNRMMLSAALDFCAYVYLCTYVRAKKVKPYDTANHHIFSCLYTPCPQQGYLSFLQPMLLDICEVLGTGFWHWGCIIENSKVPVLRAFTFRAIQTKAK